MGGLDNFLIPRVGSLIILPIPVGGGLLGTPPTFYGVVTYHPTPTFLGVLHVYMYMKLGVGKQKEQVPGSPSHFVDSTGGWYETNCSSTGGYPQKFGNSGGG